MKSLVVFYSRTGHTKKIGEIISNEANWEYEEILDTKKRAGFIRFIKCGMDATRKKTTIIKEIDKDPELYDLIILGTPVWNKRMPPATRTYINENKNKIKKVAFFCTEGGKGGPQVFESMATLCDKIPTATLEITRKEIKKNLHADKIKQFIQKIK